MSRNLSSSFKTLLTAPEFDKVLYNLLTVEHEEGLFRYVKGYENVTSNLREFENALFEITLPDESDDNPPALEVTFDAGDTNLISVLRENKNKPKVFLELALKSNPDVIEIGPLEFLLTSYTMQGSNVRASLRYEPILSEPMPGNSYTPYVFPQLF